ncbi:E3 ubiquitin protein ligase URE-B1 variant, partial [Caligus rogercresseyi]
MKIERSKLKKSSSEVPSDCKSLIERLRSTGGEDVSFLRELKRIETWTYGKCELLHWIDVLDLADRVLERSCVSSRWSLVVDSDSGLKELVLWTLHFTTLLIEHSFSRHLYSSMEHLTALLSSSDLDVVLAVLNLLYMFSKRSNFITRLSPEKRGALLSRLNHLAASWGGKDNGFGLKACCSQDASFPSSATTLHFEFSFEKPAFPPSSNLLLPPTTTQHNKKNTSVIHMERVDALTESPGCIMADLLDTYPSHWRSTCSFSHTYDSHTPLQTTTSDSKLVEVLEMKGDHLMEIKAAALKSLTSIIHLDRNPNFPKLNTIIDVTGASSYHGFLPVLVRSCIASLTAPHKEGGGTTSSVTTTQSFPQPLATALFSFLYHLASYEAGGEALVSCGMMESLLKVIQWPSTELDHITFVTRAVRVIDLITNLDMQSFQTHSGLSSFIVRLELEVEHCREQQPFEIIVGNARREPLTVDEDPSHPLPPPPSANELMNPPPDYSAAKTGLTCLPQRAALLKSMLNFLKK